MEKRKGELGVRRGKGNSGERYERDMDEEMTKVGLEKTAKKKYETIVQGVIPLEMWVGNKHMLAFGMSICTA